MSTRRDAFELESELRRWATDYRCRTGNIPRFWVVSPNEVSTLGDIVYCRAGSPSILGGPPMFCGMPLLEVYDGPGCRRAIIEERAPTESASELHDWFYRRPELHTLIYGPSFRESADAWMLRPPTGTWEEQVNRPFPCRVERRDGREVIVRQDDRIGPVRSRFAKCPICLGSGWQARGMVSGLEYMVACDCEEGRGNSNLCVIGNPLKGRMAIASGQRRRANLGGVDRNARNARRILPLREVLDSLEY